MPVFDRAIDVGNNDGIGLVNLMNLPIKD